MSAEAIKACKIFHKALLMRDKYGHLTNDYSTTQNCHACLPPSLSPLPLVDVSMQHVIKMRDGIFNVHEGIALGDREFVGAAWPLLHLPPFSHLSSLSNAATEAIASFPSFGEFMADYAWIVRWAVHPQLGNHALARLKICEKLFRFHILLNGTREQRLITGCTKTDYYHVYKVDNAIALRTCMTDRHLLKFITKKIEKEPQRVVVDNSEHRLTLRQLFDMLGVTLENFTLDSLNVDELDEIDADPSASLPMGPEAEFRASAHLGRRYLLQTFLEPVNDIGGTYFAELVHEVFQKRSANAYHLYEYKLGLAGRSITDWSELAAWTARSKLDSSQCLWQIGTPSFSSLTHSPPLLLSFLSSPLHCA